MSIVWCHPYPLDITRVLVSEINSSGTLTNSNLNITNLVLYEATVLPYIPKAVTEVPCSRSDITASRILYHKGGINDQPGGCGPPPHPRTSLKEVLP